MSECEKHQNRSIGFFDGIDARNNVVSLIERHRNNKPRGIAFRWADPSKLPVWNDQIVTDVAHQQVTFDVFNDLIRRTASGLREIGIRHGDRVIIFLPMSLRLYQTMAAVQMLGASVVFLDSWARRSQLGISAKIAGASAFISFEQAFQYCADEPELAKIPIKIVCGPHTGAYTGSVEEFQTCSPLPEIVAVGGEETALITFTTGSSGVPKGANRTHQFLASQHYALDECLPYTEKDYDLPAFPIFSLNNLAAGVTTIIPISDIGRPTERDPLMLVSQMLSCKITCATLSPSMMVGISEFCAARNIQMPSLRRIITGGAPISNETLALMKKAVPQSEIWVLYGSTEVEPIAHIEATDILHPRHGEAGTDGVNVGHFAHGLEYRFIKIKKTNISLANDDWTPLEVKKGEVGELVVAGLHVCKSYYNDPDAIAKTKVIESNGKVWHRTGDLARLDAQNNVWLVGRVHNAILRGEQMLFPVKVEMLLKRHPAVKQAAFIGMPDEKLGEKAWALVQLHDLNDPNKDRILAELATELDKAAVPFDHAGTVDNIPMDPRHHSKVEYGVLRDALLKDAAPGQARK